MKGNCKIHKFDNGVCVYDAHLLQSQRERYSKKNVHEEDEEEIFLSIIGNLSPRDVFVNVGTAIGYYPILSKMIRNDIDVHCFEPLIRHIKYLNENIELNHLSTEEFCIHQLAVSNETGEVLFNDNSYGSSIMPSRKAVSVANWLRAVRDSVILKKNKQSPLRVKAIRLAEVFHLIDKHRIHFLQMDIQGFELPVLEKYFEDVQCCSNVIESFLVGTHSAEIHKACLDLFQRNSYHILKDIQESLNQPDGIIYCRFK